MRDREQGTGSREPRAERAGEQGYMLLGALVAVALVMIALSAAFTEEAFSVRREREVESARRANQYVRAIREYYLKFQHYPGSIEQLEKTNNIRFLRQRYIDPLTGKADYRLIPVGQNKTTVKGFFGEPLAGLPGAGPGAGLGLGPTGTTAGAGANGAAGAGANGAAGIPANGAAGAAAAGAAGLGGTTAGFGAGGAGASAAANGAPQGPGASGAATQDSGAGLTGSGAAGSGGLGSGGPGSGGPGSNIGPIMGVGSSATGNSIITVNEQTSYQTWEFLYDPRLEKLKGAAALNAGAQSGSGGGNPAGIGGSSAPASTTGAPGAAGSGGTSTGPAPAGGGQPTQP